MTKAASGPPTELAGYRVRERAPIVFDYRDWKITTAPPPSSGGIALAEMLQVLAGWDLAKLDASRIASTSSSKRCAAPIATARSISAIRIS